MIRFFRNWYWTGVGAVAGIVTLMYVDDLGATDTVSWGRLASFVLLGTCTAEAIASLFRGRP